VKNKPLISIITPIFNGEKYILETIQSVLDQTYTNWEMIIVDNKSTDNSIEVIKTVCDDRIKIIHLEYNSGGPARPRNVGLDNAKGEYIAFLDADDVWDKSKLKNQIFFLKENNIEFTSSDCILIDDVNDEIQLGLLSRIYSKFIKKKTLCDVIKNNFILTSSVLIKKTLLKHFNEDKKYIAVEDFDMWLYVLGSNENMYKYQNEKFIQYRILKGSLSNRKNVLNQELKANLVLANFVLSHNQYVSCYLNRLFLFVVIKMIRNFK
jgi:teichuronic acid biosynthesis glycosyltransferase TuaG